EIYFPRDGDRNGSGGSGSLATNFRSRPEAMIDSLKKDWPHMNKQKTKNKKEGAAPMSSNGRLRVLQIGKFYPPYLGGMETHLHALCKELKKLVNLNVVVANDNRQSLRETVGGVKVSRVGTLFNFAAAPVCPGLLQ